MADKKTNNPNNSGNISLLMDVTINVTVELGRARLTVREILSLGEGSIIELQKLAGEPVDLLVNGKLIARGEVVVIDECFGVRITEIVDSINNIVPEKSEEEKSKEEIK
ncbi:flagellar motor switch protein FliN [Brachyspira innocens]|uniref:flagellar motor switch protein FliN n=1 Tax=Brachyspira innocens TaxID=13264 RepID=UPI0026F34326|nr:flagellar motor switch protein FliN [Brachyspira innocens]